MHRPDRTPPSATLASLSALVMLALVLQTSAPAVVAQGGSGSPVPRASQPRHEAVQQTIAERPAAEPNGARPIEPRGVVGEVIVSETLDAWVAAPRAWALMGLLDLPPPGGLA